MSLIQNTNSMYFISKLVRSFLPWFVEGAVVCVCEECHPADAVLGDLELPVAEGWAAVAPGVAQGVGRGDHPYP